MPAFTWIIERIESSISKINVYDRYVLTAGWSCTGTEGTFNSTAYGSCAFSEPTIGVSFIPYAELTQDQVLAWIWSNGVDKNATEKMVNEQIQNQINPPVVQIPLPWQS